MLIGLVAIVILQILKRRFLEPFDGIQPGIGCMPYPKDADLNQRNCKYFQTKRQQGTMTDANYDEYKTWCDSCDQCEWDSTKRECNVRSDYVPVDPTIPDGVVDPCSKPCTQITGERACNGCPSCISCVDRTSGNTCIDRKDYTDERCPDTDPTDGASTAPPGSNIDNDEGKNNEDDSETSKTIHPTGVLPRTEEEMEEMRRRQKERPIPFDMIDYSITESEETSIAKEKNRQAKFLQDFQSIVHNELLNEQGMTTANSQPYLKEKKDRLSANSKLNQKKGCPDMSEYVRKDSIPCWGCNLD